MKAPSENTRSYRKPTSFTDCGPLGFPLAPPSTYFARRVLVKDLANFTAKVQDFPSLTVSIGNSSGAWLEQLGGITSLGMSVSTGMDIGSHINIDSLVSTGIYERGTYGVTFSEPVYAPFETIQGVFFGEIMVSNPFPVTIATFQEPTIIEAIDAKAIADAIVQRTRALEAQVHALVNLLPGWDGEDAPKISEDTIETAKYIIKLILSKSLANLTAPEAVVGPLPDGRVRFEITHKNKELFLTVYNKDVEVQEWHPLEAIDSLGFWETNAEGTIEYLEWLLA